MDASNEQVLPHEISRLFYIYLTLAVVYMTVSLDLIEQRRHEQAKPAVEAILQLLDVSSLEAGDGEQLTRFDTQYFYHAVSREVRELRWKLLNENDSRLMTVQDVHEAGFDKSPIEHAFIYELAAYSRPISSCEVIKADLLPDERLTLLTFGLDASVDILDSSQVSIVTFNQCKIKGWEELSALIFRTDNGNVYGLPEVFLESFPELRATIFENSTFKFSKELKEKIPTGIREYIALDELFYTYSESALNYEVLAKAFHLIGESFRFNELNDAARIIFRSESQTATFLGVTSSARLILILSPVVFLFLSWNMWRRARKINSRPGAVAASSWFVFDAKTIPDKLLSSLTIIIYFSAAIAVPYFFILGSGYVLIIGDNMIELKPWLNLSSSTAPPPGYTQSNWLIGTLVTSVFVFNAVYAVRASCAFVQVVWRETSYRSCQK